MSDKIEPAYSDRICVHQRESAAYLCAFCAFCGLLVLMRMSDSQGLRRSVALRLNIVLLWSTFW